VGRWEDKDNWEGDRDLNEHAGQDWKSRILGGNYDNRYEGVKYYGRNSRRAGNNKTKSVTIGIIFLLIIGVVGFVLYDQGYFDESIQNVPQEIQEAVLERIPSDISDIDIALPDIPSLDDIEEIIPGIQKELSKAQETTKQFISPELDISNIELLVHQKVNLQRNQHGLTLLDYDNQISDIARMHSEDMATNNYFDHISFSGKEPWERGFPYGYETCGTLDAISLQNQYDKLSIQYDKLSIQYDKYPQTSTSQLQHQKAMSLYNQLNSISDQLNSISNQLDLMSENGQLFGGLAENIFQNWTYDSITYVNLIPIHDWNTDEDIAQQTVDGWMNSPGHRENILSEFHSEGIGVAVAADDKVYITQNFC